VSSQRHNEHGRCRAGDEPTVVSVAWLPGSETQLAVACAHYVRIFDLAVADRAVVNLRILGTVVCTYTLCMPDSSTGATGTFNSANYHYLHAAM
jgi:hypothetical protein